MVGAYRLLAPIGEGGMGVVHLAQGPDGKRVALKVLRPHIVGDREARERLAREVSSLQRISSPRIAEILDADPHGPVPFVVTRYVPGLSLYHHVDEEGPIAGADLLHFADALAEALQAVHSVGVLHRDIKPTNVLMEGRSPVLIDFGLARVAEDPRLTQTGWLLGTPGYLAPEILYGDDATVASDVHAWATTVAFAASGRPPYGKGPAMAIMDRVRRGEHDLSGVPAPLDRLLRECLAEEPLDRPAVFELRTAIDELRQQRAPGPAARARALDEAGRAAGRPDAGDRCSCRSPSGAGPAPAAATGAASRCSRHPCSRRPVQPRPVQARPAPPIQSWPVPRKTPSRAQVVLQLLGLGALTAALVAYAPYAGTALVATVVLLLRTASVSRQRHDRRRMVRGRPRWYDVPTTTLSMPGYLLLAFFGALALIAVAAFCGCGHVLPRLPARPAGRRRDGDGRARVRAGPVVGAGVRPAFAR